MNIKKEFAMTPYIWANVFWLPLIYIVANWFLSFKDNGVKDKDIINYINNSKIDTFFVPENSVYYDKQYDAWFARGSGGIKYIDITIFYSNEYKKYLELVLFHCFEKDCIAPFERGRVLMGNTTITARINEQQLNNPAYGTKENPVPVFGMDLLEGDSPLMGSDSKKLFHVSDTINRIFVGQYLNRFMPKAEFKKMFRGK